jgi:bile acid:Na+ symporter, BASS family
VAMQVFKSQLLPLGVGMLTRQFAPALAARVESTLGRIAGALLILLVLLVVIDVEPALVGADWRVVLAIALVTLLAVASGHLLGGPEPATRTAVAVCSAARNPGLALLVATQNGAPPAVVATIFVYLIVSALTLIPYVIYSRSAAAAGG